MGWWIYLEDEEGKALEVESHMEGGVYAIGGSPDAEMSVTYNYGGFYREHLNAEEGFRWLNGKRAVDTAYALAHAVTRLGTETSNDYWESTPGNAGHILKVLLGWAKQHPFGIWRVS